VYFHHLDIFEPVRTHCCHVRFEAVVKCVSVSAQCCDVFWTKTENCIF